MAGHNKWSKIKRGKAVADARRSKVWARITRDIINAARDGGGDPNMNPKLSLAVDKGKAENMPKENIERAIKRGTGEIEGQDYVEATYEGYGPSGIAILVEALTDNTNRTVADVRHLFSKAGGSLGTTGSVAFQFARLGMIEVKADASEEEALFEIVAEAGADDISHEDGTFAIRTPVEAFGAVQEALRAAGKTIEEDAGLQREPTTTVKLDPNAARKVAALIEKLEEHQDVQAVYSTMELDDETIEAIAG